jgi:DNA-binding transcriptional LysR family regulator
LNLAGLSFRDFEYVAAVAEFLHFGKAAQACGVSQPTLSTQIRKLEDYLGVIGTLGPYLFPLLLQPLRERYPRLRLRLPKG